MAVVDSEHEPESVRLKHLAGSKQSTSFFDKRKLVPQLAYELGFRHKTALYDLSFNLDAGDNHPHDVCFDPDRNRIWIICHVDPPRILRVNPETLAFDRITLTAGDTGYRICYDGKWVWATTDTPPGRIIRVNPDTLAYETAALPVASGHGLCIGGRRNSVRYVFVGTGTRILRFNPDLWPAYDEVDLSGEADPDWLTIRDVCDDGNGRIWIVGTDAWGGMRIAWLDVDTMAVTQLGNFFAHPYAAYSCAWDGSYVWIGDGGGRIIKLNPDTYAMDVLPLQPSFGLGGNRYVHGIQFDGKYLHCVEYHTGYYYIIHPETMEYTVHETVTAGRHNLCFDGTHIWIVDGISTPGLVERFLVHEPSRRVEHGQTETFSTAAIALISVPVTFDLPFSRAPIVVVGLNDLSDKNAEVASVEADSVTVNGFNVGCNVVVAGAGGSTARFMWIATERSTHHP